MMHARTVLSTMRQASRRVLAIGLTLLLIAPLLPAPPVSAALTTADFFGLVGRDPWYEYDPATGQPKRAFQEAMVRNIAATGARWIRIEFHTAYVSGSARVAGQMNFDETDLLINELAPAYGLKVLALLNTGILSDQPPFNYRVRDLLEPGPRERYIGAFVARSRQIAEHYSGAIAAYEVLNEPNINAELGATTGWQYQEIPPEVFGDLLTRTSQTVRTVDAHARIVLGGLLKGYPVERGTRYTTDYLRAVYSAPAVANYRAASGRYPFDGVGLHPYPNTALPRGQWLNDTLGLVGQMRTVMTQANDPGRLWITEIGVKAPPAGQPVTSATPDETFQAAWLRDVITALATTYADRVAHVFWFKYEDFPPGSPSETWGLVRLEGAGDGYAPSGAVRRVKPAYLAFRDLAAAPTSTWLFAEGYTAPGYDQYLTIMNPGPSPALVVITYMPTGAAPVVRSLRVGGRGRATVAVHDLAEGVGRGWPVAARVEANQPIVVERPMYFSDGAGRTGGHVVIGATAARTRWLFAEGWTGTGFDLYLTLQNPSATPTTVTITYLFPDGSQQRSLPLAGRTRETVAVHDVVGRGRAVSMIVESSGGVGIVAERPMYFRYGPGLTGGHVALGVAQAERSWSFAEGYTGTGFDQYFSLLNPNNQTATITLTYFLADDRTEQRTITLGPRQRGTVAAHEAGDPGGLGRGLADAARLESAVPIVAERPMYFSYGLRDGRIADGGHTVVGATGLSTSYRFAEGYTGAGFDQYFTLQNPDTAPNRLRLTFQRPDGTTIVRERTVAPRSRATVAVHDPTEGAGPDQAIATTIVSLDGRPFLAERPIYFLYGAGGWSGGHVAIGVP